MYYWANHASTMESHHLAYNKGTDFVSGTCISLAFQVFCDLVLHWEIEI